MVEGARIALLDFVSQQGEPQQPAGNRQHRREQRELVTAEPRLQIRYPSGSS
jgi:hypothetical protein